VRSARDEGKRVSVVATETRPYLQGARLTAWEMVQEGIPVTLVTDSMAGHLMQRGAVDVVVVGADRIAANGDVANKIGTYTLAVVAARHRIPFFVAAPRSSIDPKVAEGGAIPIEERGGAEVTGFRGERWAPDGVAVTNPAFDVTPAELVTGIVTERGVVSPVTAEGVRRTLEG
jgi:methylthioribose-1-phosphate isomerase